MRQALAPLYWFWLTPTKMLYEAMFIHRILDESTLVVTYRKSSINPSGVFILLHNKSAMKGSLPFIYTL